MIRTITIFALLTLIACGDDDRPAMDAGISRIDSSLDTGAPPTTACDDPFVSLVEINATDPEVMGTLLPRCSAATAECFGACEAGDGACIDACITADTTPPISDGSVTVDCGFCLDFQITYCFDQNCPTQYAALRCCREANDCTTAECPACDTQTATFEACLETEFSCAEDLQACF